MNVHQMKNKDTILYHVLETRGSFDHLGKLKNLFIYLFIHLFIYLIISPVKGEDDFKLEKLRGERAAARPDVKKCKLQTSFNYLTDMVLHLSLLF